MFLVLVTICKLNRFSPPKVTKTCEENISRQTTLGNRIAQLKYFVEIFTQANILLIQLTFQYLLFNNITDFIYPFYDIECFACFNLRFLISLLCWPSKSQTRPRKAPYYYCEYSFSSPISAHQKLIYEKTVIICICKSHRSIIKKI